VRRPDLRTANYIVGLFVDTRAYDDQSTDDVIATAMQTSDDDIRWACIRVLQERGGPQVFAAAVILCSAAEPRERETGIAILGQNLVEDKTCRTAAMPILLAVAAREQDPGVLVTLCGALADPTDARTIDPFSRWAAHPDPAVRLGVAQGLLGYEDERAVALLIALTSDEQATVRDWATFGLGTQIDTNTPTVRAALRARLDDPDADTCMEALAGLARRCDPGVIKALEVLLADEDINTLPLEAGLALADPAFHRALTILAGAWAREGALTNVIETLEEAIETCQPT
jgi:HEAT repeat protein